MSDLQIQIAVLTNELRETRMVIFEMDSRIRYLVPVVSLTSIIVGAMFGMLLTPKLIDCIEAVFK